MLLGFLVGWGGQAAALNPSSHYVGAEACESCHSESFDDWQGSHHDLAMQVANADSVAGDFRNTSFRYGDVVSTFFQRGEAYYVRTDGADGAIQEFRITHTFGLYPLQQYLIEFPDGRLQALGIAWDSRPKTQGGQRWYHLYPEQSVDSEHRLHWTGADQNWNYMCAECHSTQLEKRYDPATDTFDTRYQALNVSCEACHGPGASHIAWAAEPDAYPQLLKDKGLVVAFDERLGVAWPQNPKTQQPRRNRPRETSKEIETCARCHSRRGILSEAHVPGQPIGNTHRVNLLEEGLYHADGQPADETYVYGSFLQSRMFHEGITCSDCHNPHSLALTAPGDQICEQCHRSDVYAEQTHHFHPPESEGARCTACHMPTTRFMGVDDRHDHSFRIPRPDLSAELGSPSACQPCHTEQTHDWASAAIRKHHPELNPGFQADGMILHRARQGDPAVREDLVSLAGDADRSLMFRATAVSLLPRFPAEDTIKAIVAASGESEPLIRRAAAEAMGSVPPAWRIQVLPALLDDEVLDVRLAAAVSLASPQLEQGLSVLQRQRLNAVLDDYVAVQTLNADRADAWYNLGVLKETQQDANAAAGAYHKALSLDERFTPAAVNLYNVLSGSQRKREAKAVLRKQIKRQPDAAALFLVEGLQHVRDKQYAKAQVSLERAVELDPNSARAAYLLATLLFSTGEVDAGFERLEASLERHPFDYDSLYAIVSYAQQHKREALFRRYLPRLQKFGP